MNALAFDLPAALEATEPPPVRDGVRLMVAHRATGRIDHARFHDLPRFLTPGDLLVVNTSATIPAAVAARRESGEAVQVRLSTPAPDRGAAAWWLVELRSPDGARPYRGARAGERLDVPGGGVELVAPYAGGARLWLARIEVPGPLLDWLGRHGRPIRYGYVPREWPLSAYQTVFATEPGSAEMPSAGRPFSSALVARLEASGVGIAPLVLHTGVSSPERHEAPYPERYSVPAATADRVNAARRVIAVGTTVVRALETVAAPDGTAVPGHGWTSLVVTPERPLRAVDGLITGWHEPEASHLRLLEAAAGPRLLRRSYDAALAGGYRWHEFGDSHLILP